MKRVLLIALLTFSYLMATSQTFEGKITYSISYESLSEDMASAVEMLPKEQTFYIKNSKSKYVINSSMSSTTIISDEKASTSVILLDAMGQKFKMSVNTDEIDEDFGEDLEEEPSIEYVAGTKTIAGYVCKKAIVQLDGVDEKAVFYYTEEIAPLMLNGMEDLSIKGLPLEYIISAEGMKMVMIATKVEKTTIPDSTFDIPEGYSEMPSYMKDAMDK